MMGYDSVTLREASFGVWLCTFCAGPVNTVMGKRELKQEK